MKFDRKGSSMGSVNEFAGVRSRGEVGSSELATTEEGEGDLEPKSDISSHSGSGVPSPGVVVVIVVVVVSWGVAVVGVWLWSSERMLRMKEDWLESSRRKGVSPGSLGVT